SLEKGVGVTRIVTRHVSNEQQQGSAQRSRAMIDGSNRRLDDSWTAARTQRQPQRMRSQIVSSGKTPDAEKTAASRTSLQAMDCKIGNERPLARDESQHPHGVEHRQARRRLRTQAIPSDNVRVSTSTEADMR
ncbi:hypothetical protein Dimus_005622, partial [Dionaea muscipula]